MISPDARAGLVLVGMSVLLSATLACSGEEPVPTAPPAAAGADPTATASPAPTAAVEAEATIVPTTTEEAATPAPASASATADPRGYDPRETWFALYPDTQVYSTEGR